MNKSDTVLTASTVPNTTSASNASTSASNASTSATNAASSASSAAASYDSFDDRYLGAKTSDPTVDNDGNALITGALYFNTGIGLMKVYTGSTWLAAFASLSGALIASNNSEVNMADWSDCFFVSRMNIWGNAPSLNLSFKW